MGAREKQNVAANRAHAPHHGVGPHAHLLRGFAAGTAIAEELPARSLGKNFKGAAALVLAIIPLDQIVVLLRHRIETREGAGPNGALQRAREYRGKREPPQPLSQPPRVAFAAFGQRQIGEPGMLTGKTPSRLAVSCEVNDW